jgi:hypothetical protein
MPVRPQESHPLPRDGISEILIVISAKIGKHFNVGYNRTKTAGTLHAILHTFITTSFHN